MRTLLTISLASLLLLAAPWTHSATIAGAAPQNQATSQPRGAAPQVSQATALLADEVRHQLVMMPYYGVFDWLEAEIQPNGTATLRGQVTRPTSKSDAEARVRKIEGIKNVVSEIETLPPSPTDDAIRIALYRAIFNYNSPLFQYATRAVPPLHIVVNNGRATLKGFVASDMDKQLAYTAARGVSGILEVKNELVVDKNNY